MKIFINKNFKFYLIIFLVIFLVNSNIIPCTLWSAIGDSTKDNVTLIAKNRDWEPDHIQKIEKVISKSGYTFLGIIVENGKEPGTKTGINQKGLIVVTASAGSIPKKERDAIKNKKNLLRTLLTKYESVDAIINDQKIFEGSRPMFYMAADKDNIAYIEVAIDSKYSIKKINSGVLFHANHYLDENLLYSNKNIGKSSLARYERISYLLQNGNKQFSMDDFIAISGDQNNGPDKSIWRTGSKPNITRTLATWIAALPKNDFPIIYIKLANPNQEIKEYKIKLDNDFWNKNFILTRYIL